MKKLVSLLEVVIWAGLIAISAVALLSSERLDCPREAFICGSAGPTTWMGLARFALIAIIVPYPAKIFLYFFTRNELLRGEFHKRNKKFDLKNSALRSVLVTALAIPAIYMLTSEKIWASPDTIFERDYVWSTPIRRKWNEVVGITTWCKPGGRGSWDLGYDLIFRDGGDVDLALNVGPIAEHKVEIFSELHGRPFTFDTSAVDENCPSELREMAKEHP